MLTKTSLVVFFILSGQLGYIVMSDSRKKSKYLFKKKKIHAFLVAKSEKRKNVLWLNFGLELRTVAQQWFNASYVFWVM